MCLCLFVCLFVCLLVCLFVCLIMLVCLLVCLFVFVFCLFLCLFVCVCLLVCWFVALLVCSSHLQTWRRSPRCAILEKLSGFSTAVLAEVGQVRGAHRVPFIRTANLSASLWFRDTLPWCSSSPGAAMFPICAHVGILWWSTASRASSLIPNEWSVA